MIPKLLVTDLDGTITDKSRRLNLKSVELLRKIEEAGVRVVIATGNHLYFAEAAAVLIGATGGIIAEDGGVVRINDETFWLGDKTEMVNLLSEFEAKTGIKVPLTQSNPLRRTGIVLWKTLSEDQLTEIREFFSARGYVVVDSGFAYHIRQRNVNKGNALNFLLKKMKISPEEVIAIGDGENDYEMLKLAGKSYAVGDPPKRIREASDVVISGENGSVKALEEILRLISSKG